MAAKAFRSYAQNALRLLVLPGAVMCNTLGSDAMSAQSQTASVISVFCTDTNARPASGADAFCDSLRQALVERFPATPFQITKTRPSGAAPFVALQANGMTDAGVNARLIWQLPNGQPQIGPQLGLSVSDTNLTAAMRSEFVEQLITQSALPF